jgi:DNA-nicking Smr family endonuclease
MDFGDILDDWENRSSRPGGLEAAADAEKRLKEEERRKRLAAESERKKTATAARASLASWLDTYGVEDKDSRRGESPRDERQLRAEREAESKRLKAAKPEAIIDLHGMTQAQAEAALESFLETQAKKGLEKVLVITGKGLHSQGEPILGKAARRVLEASPFAGRFGLADASEGGGGALWVLLKKGGHFSR